MTIFNLSQQGHKISSILTPIVALKSLGRLFIHVGVEGFGLGAGLAHVHAPLFAATFAHSDVTRRIASPTKVNRRKHNVSRRHVRFEKGGFSRHWSILRNTTQRPDGTGPVFSERTCLSLGRLSTVHRNDTNSFIFRNVVH